VPTLEEVPADWRDRPTISVPTAGIILGVCRNSAYAAAARGDIPTLQIGRNLLVPTAPFRRMLGEGDG